MEHKKGMWDYLKFSLQETSKGDKMYKFTFVVLASLLLLTSCKRYNKMEISFDKAKEYLENKINIINVDNLNAENVLIEFISFYKEINIKGIKRIDQNDMMNFSYGNFKDDNNETFQIIFIRQIQKFGLKQIILTIYYQPDYEIDRKEFIYWMKYWLEDTKEESITKWKEMIEKTEGFKKYKLSKPIKVCIEIDYV